jgi:hypothetical protein
LIKDHFDYWFYEEVNCKLLGSAVIIQCRHREHWHCQLPRPLEPVNVVIEICTLIKLNNRERQIIKVKRKREESYEIEGKCTMTNYARRLSLRHRRNGNELGEVRLGRIEVEVGLRLKFELKQDQT